MSSSTTTNYLQPYNSGDCDDGWKPFKVTYGDWRTTTLNIDWDEPILTEMTPEVADSGSIHNTADITATSTVKRTTKLTVCTLTAFAFSFSADAFGVSFCATL